MLIDGLVCPFWFNIVTKPGARRGGGARAPESEPHYLQTVGWSPADGEPPSRWRERLRLRQKHLRVAEEAAWEKPRSGVKADLVVVFQQASTRELHKHRILLRKSAVFPVEAYEDPSRWILDDESKGEAEPSCLNEPGEKRDVFVSVLDHFVIRL